MSRPALSTPEQIRSTVLALLTEAGATEPSTAQSFRRAVSVRKVRERLGGGNPSTIGRTINAIESELVRAGVDRIRIPDIPPAIAELMQGLWQSAVGVQIDEIAQLRSAAERIAAGAQEEVREANLRTEMLKAELAELRAALIERDARLAQAAADQRLGADQMQALQTQVEQLQAREAELVAETLNLQQTRAQAIAAAQERYEGLSRHLLEETAQQRRAATAEVERFASQLKFAEKRNAALEARLAEAETELARIRAEKEQASGEAAAFRYANSALRSELEELVLRIPPAPLARIPGLARGRMQRTLTSRTKGAKAAR